VQRTEFFFIPQNFPQEICFKFCKNMQKTTAFGGAAHHPHGKGEAFYHRPLGKFCLKKTVTAIMQ
jgi:hypothetical protein